MVSDAKEDYAASFIFLHKKIKYLILIEFICTILCGIHRANPHPIYYRVNIISNIIDDYY